jgi:ParB family chromosome partitioning protein
VEKKALGKGLKALIGEPEEFARYEVSSPWRQIALDEIDPNPRQPRGEFDPEKLEALVASIRSNGVLQPVIVRPAGTRYQLIAGERRWRAAKMANLLSVPAIVRDADDRNMLALALVENLQRQDLNPIEEGQAYKELIEEHGLTQELLGQLVGKDRSTVANMMRLLSLPDEVKLCVSRGTLSMGHARALLGLSEPAAQTELCRRVVREGLSVRQAEGLVKTFGRARPKRNAGPVDPDVRRLEEDLQRALGTKVRLLRAGKGGKIQIEFYSDDELEALLERLLRLGGRSFG